MVITGMGMLTPVGNNVEETWHNILAGVSGVGPVEDFDVTDYSTKIWAKVKQFDSADLVGLKDSKKMDMFTQFGIAAADEAMLDAGLVIDEALSKRAGVAVGAGIGGIQTITNNQDRLLAGGPRKVSPFFIPAISRVPSTIR